ncbi:MAG: hypothetical protein WCA63_13580 [Gallionella sp.]
MKQLAIRLSWQTTPAKSLVMFERVARVPQPPDQSSNAGNRAAAANRGRLFFGYFLLAKQKKVACCRATPAVLFFLLFIFVQSSPEFIESLNPSTKSLLP